MTLDEYITSLRLSIAKHITIFDCTTNEEHKKMAADLIEESKQVLEWLEELKAKRNIGEEMMSEEVLKFYYIESEDKYVVGQRVDTMYYAEVTPTGLHFYMSRYLPWGEHVVSPNSLWKEHTYCSEPKEISFFEWLSGFMKKQGWEW